MATYSGYPARLVEAVGTLLISESAYSYIKQLRLFAAARDLRIFWFLILSIPVSLAVLDAAARIGKHLGLFSANFADALSVSLDYSIAEWIGYAELLASAILIWMASGWLRDVRLKVVAAIVFYLMCDDMLLIHDTVRVKIGQALFPGNNFTIMSDKGEVVYFSGAIAVILAVLALAYRNATRLQIFHLLTVVVGLAAFALFAVVFDQFGSVLGNYAIISERFHHSIQTIEDSGELFGIGLIFMASLILYRLGKAAPSDPSLED
jgi:hypothetical protein